MGDVITDIIKLLVAMTPIVNLLTPIVLFVLTWRAKELHDAINGQSEMLKSQIAKAARAEGINEGIKDERVNSPDAPPAKEGDSELRDGKAEGIIDGTLTEKK